MLHDAAIAKLQANLRGKLIQPSDPGYDEARRVFNGMIDRRPALIAQCESTEDVTASLQCARDTGIVVSVRGGGHGVTGNAVCDDGIVIDLSKMRKVQVDSGERRARAEGGSTWGDYDQETQAYGLASTGGIVPSTGVSGLTLGGGIGYLNRKFGLACDNLVAADVVTADGQLLRASGRENADLFWGLRGGGGNFGVVTSLEYQVHPLGPVLAGEVTYPLSQAKEVLRFYRDWSTSTPDEVRADATLLTGPEGPVLDVVICYCGRIAEGERVLRPMRSFGSPVRDTVAAVPYQTIQNLLSPIFQPGHMHYWKAGFVKQLSDEAIEAIVDFFAREVPGFFAGIVIEHLGGAISRVRAEETAYPYRDAQHSLLVLRMWDDPQDTDRNMDWGRGCYRAAEPFLHSGTYVNYLGDEGEARIKDAYGANYQRLRTIKKKYDPENVFRLNQNIRPS